MAAGRPPGRILTFYSYKGGTGRSMALANLAWILAGNGKRVLAIDWDLEAPGLHRYFRPFLIDEELASSEGLMDLIDSYATQAMRPVESGFTPDPDWYLPFTDLTDYVVGLNFPHFPSGGKIDLLPAGRQTDGYAMAVSSFNWQNFYDRLGGGGFFEAVRDRARSLYDYVLIDSRTGVSDTAGICSVQMPDTLVVCFTYNNQSMKGAAAVARSALDRRRRLVQQRSETQRPRTAQAIEDTPRPYRVFPVPMRVDSGESERLALRQAFARDIFADLVTHIGPSELPEYWSGVEVPHKVFYSYEEVLAPFKDDPLDPKTVLSAFVRLARYLTDRDVKDYRLPIAPDVRQRFLETFAETPLTAKAKEPVSRGHVETAEETLCRQADAALGRLDEEEREIARRALGRLVRVGRPEEGGGFYPIRVKIGDFSDREKQVLSKLAYSGIVAATVDSGPVSVGPVVPADLRLSFADERLVRVWKTLREWIEADHEFLAWRQQLRNYLGDWERSGNDRGALLSGRLLGEADLWTIKRKADLNATEIEYVEKSRAAPPVGSTLAYQTGEMPRLANEVTTASMPVVVVPPAPRPSRWGLVAAALALVVIGAAVWWLRHDAALHNQVSSPSPTLPQTLVNAPPSAEALIAQGDRAAAAGDTDAALAAYKTATGADPGSAVAYLRLGRTYDGLRDFAAAAQAYNQALRLAPKDPEGFFNRGTSRTLQGDLRNAVDDFTRAIALDGRNPAYHFNRGIAKENLGDAAGAIADYTQAIQLKQDYAEPYLKRAALYEKRNDRQAAVADYRAILSLNINDPAIRKVAEVRLRSLAPPLVQDVPKSTPPPGTPRLFLHYNDRGDARIVQQLRNALAKRLAPVPVVEVEPVSAPSAGDVRFFFKEDAGMAERVRREAEAALAEQGYKVELQIFYRDARKFPRVQQGTLELWLPSLSRSFPARSSESEGTGVTPVRGASPRGR
jgi:tetratricopeptide (TPR) repeat protein